MIGLLLGVLLAILVPWGAQLLQAGAFAVVFLKLTGVPVRAENGAYALALYTLVHVGLARYRPRFAYALRLAFCALWAVAGAAVLTQSTAWSWPLSVVLGAVLGACLGGRANFGSARALWTYLEIEASALSDAIFTTVARLRAPRPPLAPPNASERPPDPAPRTEPRSERPSYESRHAHTHAQAPREPPRPPPPPPPREDDPWTVLGVAPGANREALRRAYLECMRQYHPDRVANLGPELRALAEEKCKQINRAYETLRGRR